MSVIKSTVKKIVPKKYRELIWQLRNQSLSYRQELEYFFRGWRYAGNKVVCPCCGGNFSQFLPVGVRANAECPRCTARERHRLIWMYLKNKTNLFSESLKVLHIAPEFYFQKKLVRMSNLDYLSGDLDSPLADVKIDITNIQYPDNSFDVILCNHVLEHIPDDRQAMQELFRVLKPEGWGIFQVPLDLNSDGTVEGPSLPPQERKRLFGQIDHVRLYGKDYKQRLEQAGFTVKVDEYVKELDCKQIEKYGLRTEQDVYFCTQK